nr:SPFH domain-containing protein [Spiroplasma sp. AdecLV25b]
MNALFWPFKITATTLRNTIGDLELDKTLTSRDEINGRLQITLDEATNSWGIKVVRVEVKNIQPPREVKESMEKQMRAAILTAEGDKASRILMAEGKAQALLVQQQALASSIDILNKSTPNQQVLLLRSLETMEKVADGNATKIIIPSNLQNLAGGAFATLGEVFKETSVVGKKQKNNNLETDVISTKPKK